MDDGWQDISTAPKNGRSRLVWCPEYENTYLVSWSEYDECWAHFGGNDLLRETPTHWRPLPAPPDRAIAKVEGTVSSATNDISPISGGSA